MHLLLNTTLSHALTASCLTATLCVGILTARSAEVIATAELSAGVGSHVVASSGQLYVSNGGATNGGTAAIFDSFVFTNGQAGQVFSVAQSVDPQFNLFVSRLTNGVNDLLTRTARLIGGSSSGALSAEGSFFSTRPFNGNGIDLAGFNIERIDMKINQLSIASPGSNQSGDGIWTDYSIQATLSFLGAAVSVPEPSGAALLLAGLACLKLARTRFRSRR